MPVIYPKAVWQPVANHSGVMSAHYGLVVHVQVGSGSCYGEFNNPASQASSTWQAMKDGTVLQFVDADYVAWTEMAGNPYYDSVETEGTPDEPLTAEQCQSLAELMAWGHGRYGWPLVLVDHGGRGITTHAHYPSGQPDPAYGNHPCPGPIRAGQLPGIVAAAARQINQPPTQGEDDMYIIACDGQPTFLVLGGLCVQIPDAADLSVFLEAGAKTVRVDVAQSQLFAKKAG